MEGRLEARWNGKILLALAFWLPVFASQESSPAAWSYLCQRYNAAVTKHVDAIYLYGGSQNIPSANNTLSSSTYDGRLIKIDLSYPWDVRVSGPPMQYEDVNISSQSPPARLVGSALFQDPVNPRNLILYGGGVSHRRTDPDILPPSSSTSDTVWIYDTVDKTWAAGEKALGNRNAPRRGASAEAPELSLAFYLNGIIGNGKHDEPFEEMLILNTSSRESWTVPTTAISNATVRIGARMEYIASIGTKGALVLIGGGTRTTTDSGYEGDEISAMAPLDIIWILDVASLDHNGTGTWYAQKTSGRTPPARADACLATAVASDRSSYNIYMLGGYSTNQSFSEQSYDEVWVLSLPQFVWTQVATGTKPIFGRTCHLVGNRQMLAMGGNDVKAAKRGVQCTHANNYIVVFEMTTLKWSPLYVKEDNPYHVPRAVYEWIGGDGFGNANMIRPNGDFSSLGLAELFNVSLVGMASNTSSVQNFARSFSIPMASVLSMALALIAFI